MRKLVTVVFVVFHALLAGVCFFAFEWWNGFLALIPFFGEIFYGIKLLSTTGWYFGVIALVIVSLMIVMSISDAIRVRKERKLFAPIARKLAMMEDDE